MTTLLASCILMMQHIQPLFILLIISLSYAREITKLEDIIAIRERINSSSAPYCHGAHSNTVKVFLFNQWKQPLQDHVALIYPFCLKTNELGNRLGNYLNEFACADVIGADFITIHIQFDMIGSYLGQSNETVEPLIFLKSLPEYVIHQTPSELDMAQAKAKELCKCTQYCWQDRNGRFTLTLPRPCRLPPCSTCSTMVESFASNQEAFISFDTSLLQS
jgi:hypothetical protein